MSLCLLDTDILTEIFKRRNRPVAEHARAYLLRYRQLAFSAMTRFEIVRGLRHKQASGLSTRFDGLAAQSLILPISDEVLDRAADLWVEARTKGRSHRDADLIIAATALLNDRILVTGNTAHFDWVPGLRIENWRES
jgi:predicted nucleic acid-binding protein